MLRDKLDTMDTIQPLQPAKANSVHTVHIVPKRPTQETVFESIPNRPPDHTPERRRMISPAMVESYRAARQWLLLRLDALLAAGWTRNRLFRIKPPLGHPYGFGVAWFSWWTAPGMVPRIGPAGEVEFCFPDGAVLRARP